MFNQKRTIRFLSGSIIHDLCTVAIHRANQEAYPFRSFFGFGLLVLAVARSARFAASAARTTATAVASGLFRSLFLGFFFLCMHGEYLVDSGYFADTIVAAVIIIAVMTVLMAS